MATGETHSKSMPLNNSKEIKLVMDKSIDVDAGLPKSPGNRSKSEYIVGTQGVVDNQYFFEDEVFRINKKGHVEFGLVIETSESFSDEEEEDFEDILKKGDVRVAWHPDGIEDVNSESTLGLADRTLMPGDVVRRMVPGKDTQRGYCREIDMNADVRIVGTKYVIKNVNAKRLRLINYWQRDTAVCLDSWVGSTKDYEEKAVLKASSGARVEISSNDYYGFKDANTRYSRGIFSPHVFYPGNYISGRVPENAKLLTPNIPLPKNKKGKNNLSKYLVESVRTECVWVHWQCKALSADSNLSVTYIHEPNSQIKGEELDRLKRLNLFEACMLQINDRTSLQYLQNDIVIKKSQWDKEQSHKFKLLFEKQRQEENQNVFVHNISSSSNPNHHDKLKKRSSLDIEKTCKLKKGQLKVDKPNKEKVKQSKVENFGNDSKTTQSYEWLSDGEDAVDSNENVTTTVSTPCSSPSPRGTPKHNFKLRPSKLKIKSFKKSTTNLKPIKCDYTPKDGTEIITETLLVYSTATVVWQDGTIEHGIPSTDLYPIHHLDNNEFFPGDFVVLNNDHMNLPNFRDYGVIQKVDHTGRTALVKWFKTYTAIDNPKPAYNGESEVSVYDLKDHPDFQYRPGTMVIRVANFVGEDANCTAGQIMDNYVDGRVKVWWVDGHVSMCWPQDLFEVRQQDANDWGEESETESWETESENSEIGSPSTPKNPLAESQLLSNIERARVDIARLEEIFHMSPKYQSSDVMKKLLSVYKGCRYFDRLMNTNFFHENNFLGLVERVRRGGSSQSIIERAQDRKNRLFSPTTQLCFHAVLSVNGVHNANADPAKEYAPKVLFNFSTASHKSSTHVSNVITDGSSNSNLNKRKTSSVSTLQKGNNSIEMINGGQESVSPSLKNHVHETTTSQSLVTAQSFPNSTTVSTPTKDNSINAEKNELLNSAILNIEKAFETTKNTILSKDDSGNFSRNENLSDSCASVTDFDKVDGKTSLCHIPNDNSISCSSIEFSDEAAEYICGHMCSLLKEQLLKCIEEIRRKYYKEDTSLNINKDKLEVFLEEKKFDILEADKVLTPDSQSEKHETIATSIEEDGISNSHCLSSKDHFQVIPNAPKTHKYHLTLFHPKNPQQYLRAVQREHRLLRTSLPPGVWVKVFEDRMDLLSVMIEGPKKTPYEDGMFLFDMQLGHEYPLSPPLCYYISYCSDRLNPNLYEDGKVCVSLLGTWTGRDTEVWGANSTLLQVIVSIQGLILVPEPYFNEAGYEKQKGSQEGKENSRMYNEMAIIKLVQATTKLLQRPPPLFRIEIVNHFKTNGLAMHKRFKGWIELSKMAANTTDREDIYADNDFASCSKYVVPEFPLIPASRGFCLTLAGLLDGFEAQLLSLELNEPDNYSENIFN